MKVWFSILLVVTLTFGAAAQENIGGDGILLHGKTVVLFAHVSTCAAQGDIPAAQIVVSPDSGKSWEKRGLRLDGSTLRLVLDDGVIFELLVATQRKGQNWIPFSSFPTRISPRGKFRRFTGVRLNLEALHSATMASFPLGFYSFIRLVLRI